MLDSYPKHYNQGLVVDLLMLVFLVKVQQFLRRSFLDFYKQGVAILAHRNKPLVLLIRVLHTRWCCQYFLCLVFCRIFVAFVYIMFHKHLLLIPRFLLICHLTSLLMVLQCFMVFVCPLISI